MQNNLRPEKIILKVNGDSERGFLTAVQDLQFHIKRCYWTYDIPAGTVRGHHAHKKCTQLLVCLRGNLEVYTELPNGTKEVFVLSNPSEALILWPHVWHEIKYSENALQLVMASMEYDENDYLRNKVEFKKYYA